MNKCSSYRTSIFIYWSILSPNSFTIIVNMNISRPAKLYIERFIWLHNFKAYLNPSYFIVLSIPERLTFKIRSWSRMSVYRIYSLIYEESPLICQITSFPCINEKTIHFIPMESHYIWFDYIEIIYWSPEPWTIAELKF